MVKVVGTDYLREALGTLPPECYGENLDNPEGYFSNDVNPPPFNAGPRDKTARERDKGVEKKKAKD